MFDLRFDDQGQGEVVVLLPPFPFDRRVWSANIPALVAAGHRVLAIDYPGFGHSPPVSPEAFSLTAIAEATAALLEKLALVQVTLVGLSMGGYVALAFAACFPTKLRALVLADTRASADSEVARQGRAQALETIATRGVEAYLAGALPRQLAPDAPSDALNVILRVAEKRSAPLVAALAALRDRPDRTDTAARIACPTLVIAGAEDQITPAAEMRGLAHTIRGARFVELPGAGHLSNVEAPAPFNKCVVEFLRDLPKASPTQPTATETA